jgi:branched-chain amino acid transport system permease protein
MSEADAETGARESVKNRYEGLKTTQRWLLWIAVVVAVALIPIFVSVFVPNNSLFVMNTFIYLFLFMIMGHGWNVVGGYAGQISLGHAVMFAVGAYTTAVLFAFYGVTPFVGVVIAALVATAVGLVLGAVTFSLRYHYFAMATLAAALIAKTVVTRWDYVNGASGIEYPLSEIGSVWSLTFADKAPYFYLTGLLALGTTLFMYQLDRSKLGTYLKAVNMDQELAENAGLKAWWYKMYAMGISSFITGLAGAMYAQYILYIDPLSTLRVLRNIDIIMVAVIGGVGTVLGPVAGAFIFIPVREITRTSLSGTATGMGWVVFGLVLLLISMYRPGGLLNKFTGRGETNDGTT